MLKFLLSPMSSRQCGAPDARSSLLTTRPRSWYTTRMWESPDQRGRCRKTGVTKEPTSLSPSSIMDFSLPLDQKEVRRKSWLEPQPTRFQGSRGTQTVVLSSSDKSTSSRRWRTYMYMPSDVAHYTRDAVSNNSSDGRVFNMHINKSVMFLAWVTACPRKGSSLGTGVLCTIDWYWGCI